MEDNSDNSLLIIKILQNSWAVGAEIETLVDGAAALDFLFRTGTYENAVRPDVILLDLNLPKIDGREVLRRIFETLELRTIPVVVLTVSDSPPDRAAAAKYGAARFITKPAHLDQLEAALVGIGELLED